RGANPHAELFLVLGWDAASQLRSWHRPDEVLAIAPIVVVSRPGRDAPEQADIKSAGLDPARIVLCPHPTPSVSGSGIRRAIAAGMVEAAKARQLRPLGIDGYDDAGWILLDFDSVLAHVFLPGERSYYDLESLWAPASKRRRKAS